MGVGRVSANGREGEVKDPGNQEEGKAEKARMKKEAG